MRRIVACYFGSGAGDQWPRLARVFAFTAARHCPTWDMSLRCLPEPRPSNQKHSHVANTLKLEHWCSAIDAASDGDEVMLIDVDTAILQSLDSIWDKSFDVAYTERAKGWRYPLNGGVVFVRVTPSSRAFIGQWRAENQRMVDDETYLNVWRRRYAGINQAAFGALLERGGPQLTAKLVPIPCREWNCEDSTWSTFDAAVTRVLHVKSALRRQVFHLAHTSASQPHLKPLVKMWRQLEIESQRVMKEAV